MIPQEALMMKKAVFLLSVILILLASFAYFFAPPEATQLLGWIAVGIATIFLVILVIAAGIGLYFGVPLFKAWTEGKKMQSKIFAHPNDNGDMPSGVIDGKVVNFNLPPDFDELDEDRKLQVWAWLRATSGKNGTPPAQILGNMIKGSSLPMDGDDIKQLYDVAMPGDSKVLDAVAESYLS